MDEKLKLLRCAACRWVSYAMSRGEAEYAVERYNLTLAGKTPDEVRDAGGRMTIERFEHCAYCGASYKFFVEAEDGAVERGVTLNPILHIAEGDK